jgi:hypothetical protein
MVGGTDKGYTAVLSMSAPGTQAAAGLLVISLHSRLVRGHGDALFGNTLTYLRLDYLAAQ